MNNQSNNQESKNSLYKWTGICNDLGEPSGKCENPGCGHRIRYEYEMKHVHTGEIIVVGSECVRDLDWTVTAKDKRLKTAKEKAQKARIVKELREKIEYKIIQAKNNNKKCDYYESLLKFLNEKGYLTDKQKESLSVKEKNNMDYGEIEYWKNVLIKNADIAKEQNNQNRIIFLRSLYKFLETKGFLSKGQRETLTIE